MRKLIRLAFVVICVYLSAGAGLARQGPGAGARRGAPAAPRRGTILLVGVTHAPGQFVSERFSPAHVRAALRSFKPQVVGVESNPEWFAKGRYYLDTYEAQNVAVPWAARQKIPVYGVDWIGDLYDKDKDYVARNRVEQARRARADSEAASVSVSSFQYGLASREGAPAPKEDPELDFVVLNGPAYGEKWVKWIDQGKHEKGSPQEYMEERDNHIVEYITAAADKHPGARMAVVIGAAHRGDLERKLRARGFEVVGPTDGGGGPGAARAVTDEQLTAEDIAAILSEAWDSTRRPGVARARAGRLLARLHRLKRDDPRAGAWGEYFDARRRMLEGDLGGAGAAFGRIAAGAGETRFPYRGGRWRHHLTLRQAALLELGRIADLRGRRGEAVGHYTRLLGSLKVPEYSEDYHSDYVFLATARNAVRALTLAPYTKDAGGAGAEASESAAASAPAGGAGKAARALQRSMELGRSGDWAGSADAADAALRDPDATQTEKCEGYILAAGARFYAMRAEDSRPFLSKFDSECGGLPGGHWVYRERKKLEPRKAN